MTHHLVAGGGGFIGSHLVDSVLERGDTVTIVDNFCTGRPANIAHLAHHPRCTLIEHDITTPLPTSITDGRYDTVLDLASPASPHAFTRPARNASVKPATSKASTRSTSSRSVATTFA